MSRTVKISAVLMTMALVGFARGQELMDQDPVGDISLDMQVVVTRLTRKSTDEPTQEVQKEVVGKLDALIKELEQRQRQQQQGNGAGTGGKEGRKASVIAQGEGGIGDLHAARMEGADWGKLPERERARILQSRTEGFPAHYQDILERYYKRLAEEKPAAELDRAEGRAMTKSPARAEATPK